MRDRPDTKEDSYYRHINGSAQVTLRSVPSLRFEKVDRTSADPVLTHYRQPCLSLFLFETGYERFTLDVAGVTGRVARPDRCVFALLPSAAEVKGEFHAVDRRYAYSIAHIELGLLGEDDHQIFERPLIGFEDPILQRGMAELASWDHDPTFPLIAEGWALQSIARLRERLGALPPPVSRASGLSLRQMKMVTDFVAEHLQASLTLQDLAAVTGLGIRQFARSFRAATGQTPARYIHERRLDQAKDLLARSTLPMTDIAFACGFSHAQHFSNSFQRSTGSTPTRYRQAHLARPG